MRPLKRRDPAPSKTGFRLRRLWRSRAFRRGVTLWAPLLALTGAGVWAAAQPEIRAEVTERYGALRYAMVQRPEFAIRRVEIIGASPRVEAELHAALGPLIGVSSLEVDARAARALAEGLGWVRAARVRLEAPETLRLTISERTPAVIWRQGGSLTLLDAHGAVIDLIDRRANRPDLPVIAGPGAGAPEAVAEALRLFAAAGHLAPRLRGLTRIGARRWNMTLADGPVVMLPAEGALDALGYIVALDAATRDESARLLRRDVARVDLRVARRPTLRLGPGARRRLDAARLPEPDGEDA